MRTFAQKQNQPQKQVSPSLARSNTAAPGLHHRADLILHLQRTIGNQAVQRMLQTHAEELKAGLTGTASPRFGHDFSRIPIHPPAAGAIQTKLTINKPGDEYEQEADRISEQVMRGPGPALQRACSCGGGCPNCQTDQPGQEHERVQTKAMGSSDLGVTAAPPIVHEVLGSPGQPLSPATRAFMEPRFGHDFSGVRVHTDLVASRSADAVAAQAYTVGADIVFGAGRYAPASRDGQRLLAHELAHVQQQQSGPALQRQPLLGEPEQAIPTELRSSANVGQMTHEELADRHDQILEVLGQFTMSTPETALLEREAARIGVELARRKALAEGRTFGEDSIKKMKDYFVKNSQKPTPDSCIVCLNKAMKIGTDKPALPTTPETIEKTMAKIAASGHSGVAREVWFLGKGGKITRGGARPEKLQASIWDTVMSLAGGDPGWSVFTMSLLDGYHSVTLTLDANDPSTPHMYWSDQWKEKGGWQEYTRSGLDAEVTRLVQEWWDGQKEGGKHTTVVRVWRVSATPAAGSGP